MTPYVQQAIKKALQSTCTHKVSAIAYDWKGQILGFTSNQQGYHKKGGGIHAECKAIRKWGKRIKTILICRANVSGQLLPIHACDKCRKMADKNGIVIKTIEDKVRFEAYEKNKENKVDQE
jgi:cytidine deaminase